MIVIDASFAVDFLLHAGEKSNIAEAIALQERLSAPSLIEYEVSSVLRRHNIRGELSDQRAKLAFEALSAMQVQLYDAFQLTARAWDLRQNITFYDATYVALAEMLDAPLYTTDKRLASAPGHHARIICF